MSPCCAGCSTPGTRCGDPRCWPHLGGEAVGKGSPTASTLPHCHCPWLVAVPWLSGSFGWVMMVGGCWAFPSPPPSFQGGSSWLEREWSSDLLGKGTCWGQAPLPSCPELPCTKPLFTQCLWGITGVLLPPPQPPHLPSCAVLQGRGRSSPRAVGVAVPRGSCCCGCLLLLPRDTPFNKIISVARLLGLCCSWVVSGCDTPRSQWEWGSPALPLGHSPRGTVQESGQSPLALNKAFPFY